jgi:hypothetical protein
LALHLYVDADACPVKDEVYRVARRHRLRVTLVANARIWVPLDENVRLQVVEGDLDAADDWIAEQTAPGDIVITNDIPLASRCLAAGAAALRPNGEPFTEDNIGSALASRELLAELRQSGLIAGGPSPFRKEDRSRFLQALEEAIRTSARRQESS